MLETIQTESKTQPRLKPYANTLQTVSASYAPGLSHTYDVADLPRTNNARESEFRDLQRRLLTTTGQRGATKRWIQRKGAWELIPGPSTLRETVQALTHVAPQEFEQEQQRVHTHRLGFGCTRAQPNDPMLNSRIWCGVGECSRRTMCPSEFCRIAEKVSVAKNRRKRPDRFGKPVRSLFISVKKIFFDLTVDHLDFCRWLGACAVICEQKFRRGGARCKQSNSFRMFCSS